MFDIEGTTPSFVISLAGVTVFSVAGGSVNVQSQPFYVYTQFKHLGGSLAFFSATPVVQQLPGAVTAGYRAVVL